MADKNLSPRQKMINMMYLVLTALLALQVSKGVLEKFYIIRETIRGYTSYQLQHNDKVLQRIAKKIDEGGNRSQDSAIYEKGLAIKQKGEKLLAFIQQTEARLIAGSGGVDHKTGRILGLKDESIVTKIMINESQGAKLKSLLETYRKDLTSVTGQEYERIALGAKDFTFLKKDPNQKEKDFVRINFEATPLVAALAILSQLASKAVYMATDALENLARQVGANDFKFDQVTPIIRPEARYVVAGTNYKADLFLTAFSSAINPSMQVNGKAIPVKNGVGLIKFPVQATRYNADGYSKQRFKASICLPRPGGEDSVLTETVEYYVVQPTLQIQSRAVQALYRNCGNELDVQVPALGTQYTNPSFTVTGGEVLQSGGVGKITIIPRKKKVEITVKQNGALLGKATFAVRNIPKPTLAAFTSGRKIDEGKGVPAPGPVHLKLKVIPDPSFAEFLPSETKYRVKQYVVRLARGTRAIKTKTYNQSLASLNDFLPLAKPGDRLVIDGILIERLNFKREAEPVDIQDLVKVIPII